MFLLFAVFWLVPLFVFALLSISTFLALAPCSLPVGFWHTYAFPLYYLLSAFVFVVFACFVFVVSWQANPVSPIV